MRKIRRAGIAIMLTAIMVLSIFAVLPAATAAPGYTWRDYEYPMQPQFGTALRFKMYTVDILEYQLPSLKYYAQMGVFDNAFLVSYMKIREFMYRSCDPDLWWFQNEMFIYSYMYGNYPGDNSKPIPQSAVSQGKKIFQDEYVVMVELNTMIRKLTEDWEASTGLNHLIYYSMLLAMKQIRNQLLLSDMVVAYNILDISNAAVDAIENSNGKVDLTAVGGPSDFSLQNQQQILKWTASANDEFDSGSEVLELDPSFVRSKLDANQQYWIIISTELDSTAYTTAMKSYESTLNEAGHALAMSGGMEFCMDTFVFILPAAVGIILCIGGVVVRRKRNQ
jgi:hypothetical protein